MITTIARLLPEYILTLRHKGRTEATLRAYTCDLHAAGAGLLQSHTRNRIRSRAAAMER